MTDWFSCALQTAHTDKLRFEHSDRSKQWAKPLPEPGPKRLHHILQACRNISRAIALPKHCEFGWATIGKAAGRAGFYDAPDTFLWPFVQLDKGILESECPEDLIVDVYCGVTLHETSHILNTRHGFRVLPTLNRIETVFRNLWEDEYVEQYVRTESPGFVPYIHAAKEVLLRSELRKIEWEELPDLDRVNLLLFAFIRLPELIREEWKSFQTIQSTCVFQRLCSAASSRPVQEMDYQHVFEATMDVWTECLTEYPTKWDEYHRQRRNGGISAGTAARLRKQLFADALDRVIGEHGAHPPVVVDKLTDFAIQLSEQKCLAADRAWFSSAAEQTIELATGIEASGNVMFGRRGKRFGLPELIGIDQKTNEAGHPISESEAIGIQRLEAEAAKEEAAEKLCLSATIEDRNVVLLQPQVTANECTRYRKWVAKVQPHISATRAALPKFAAKQTHRLDSLRHGALDRRRLWSGSFEERLFFQTEEHNRQRKSLAIGLLLDESGSMSRPSNLSEIKKLLGDRSGLMEALLSGAFRTKGDYVLEIAALFCESLHNSRANIELEIYSHTSTQQDECQLKYLYGRQQPDPQTIGCYQPSSENYDGVAIEAAAELLRKNTSNPEKMLIVISDGAPSDGKQGIKHARRAVENVRRSRIQVVGIAVAAYAAEKIYGAAHTLVYEDLNTFAQRLRSMLLKLAR